MDRLREHLTTIKARDSLAFKVELRTKRAVPVQVVVGCNEGRCHCVKLDPKCPPSRVVLVWSGSTRVGENRAVKRPDRQTNQLTHQLYNTYEPWVSRREVVLYWVLFCSFTLFHPSLSLLYCSSLVPSCFSYTPLSLSYCSSLVPSCFSITPSLSFTPVSLSNQGQDCLPLS